MRPLETADTYKFLILFLKRMKMDVILGQVLPSVQPVPSNY